MRLELDARRALVSHLPDLSKEQLAKHSQKHVELRQAFLTHLFAKSYERRRPHKDEPRKDSFSRDELVSGLRCAPRRYGTLLAPYYDFPRDNRGYSVERRVTKAYELRSHVFDAVDEVFTGTTPLPLIDTDTGERVAALPPNGMPMAVDSELVIPSVIPLGADRVDAAMERLAGWIAACGPTKPFSPDKPDGLTLNDAFRLLKVARRWTVSIGGLPNLYELQSHGRLGPSSYHIISMPSTLRRLLFQGSRLHDYDVSACYWNVYLSLGRAIGFDVSEVALYVEYRNDIHEAWERETGIPRSHLKPITTSWLTGGTLSTSIHTEAVRTVGVKAMSRLQKEAHAQRLYNQVREGMKRIRDAATREKDGRSTVFVNAVGEPLVTEGKPQEFGAVCAHILTGYEQFAIREACRRAQEVQAIIYDGFIAPKQDTTALEEAIRSESGSRLGVELELTLKSKPFADPVDDLRPTQRLAA